MPGAALLVTWVALGSFVGWYFGVEGFGRVVKLVVSPLWFLGVYLMLIALLPLSLWLHRRYGMLVLVWLAGLAMLVDVARFHYQIEDVGWINMLLIWALAHQAGFFYDTVVKGPARSTSRCCGADCSASWDWSSRGCIRVRWWACPGNASPTWRRRRS